jgi:ABC-type Fe3+-siderophore transport system permease subunit
MPDRVPREIQRAATTLGPGARVWRRSGHAGGCVFEESYAAIAPLARLGQGGKGETGSTHRRGVAVEKTITKGHWKIPVDLRAKTSSANVIGIIPKKILNIRLARMLLAVVVLSLLYGRGLILSMQFYHPMLDPVIYQLKTGHELSNQNRPVVSDIPRLMGIDQAALFS